MSLATNRDAVNVIAVSLPLGDSLSKGVICYWLSEQKLQQLWVFPILKFEIEKSAVSGELPGQVRRVRCDPGAGDCRFLGGAHPLLAPPAGPPARLLPEFRFPLDLGENESLAVRGAWPGVQKAWPAVAGRDWKPLCLGDSTHSWAARLRGGLTALLRCRVLLWSPLQISLVFALWLDSVLEASLGLTLKVSFIRQCFAYTSKMIKNFLRLCE